MCDIDSTMLLRLCSYYSIPYHYGVVCPQITVGGETHKIWWLYYEYQMVDKMFSLSLGIGKQLPNPHPKNPIL